VQISWKNAPARRPPVQRPRLDRGFFHSRELTRAPLRVPGGATCSPDERSEIRRGARRACRGASGREPGLPRPISPTQNFERGAPMASDNEARRRRYAESPKLRKKAQARSHAYYEANKDENNADARRKRREGDGSLNARRRKQYAENPEKRRKARARARRYRRAKKAKIAEQRRLDRKQNPEKMRKQHIQYTYGLSWDEYQAILARQGGVCGMCKTKSKRPLCVDHCHKTGMVRGILCSPCNLTIGLCRDSTKITRAATAYLEAAQKRIRRKLRGKKKKKARSSPRATRAGAVRSPATNPAAPRRRSGRKPCRPSAGRARGSRSRRGASRHRDLRGGCTRSRRSRPGGGGSRGPGCGRG
jgi:hypothetical protein